MSLLSALLLTGCGDKDKAYKATEAPAEAGRGSFPISHDPARLDKIGPQACAECHEKEVRDWEESHHANANRPVSPELDSEAFNPTRRIKESGVTYEMAEENGEFLLRVLPDDENEAAKTYKLVGVIAHTPIRQYLAEFPDGRYQTISASYDVKKDRWVDVFANEDRQPGEWGHWTGQGMNWNANCAYCHTTEYEKNYNLEENAYHSSWVQQGLACATCHSGLETHVEAARQEDYETGLTTLDQKQRIHNCAICHSRRDQLTAEGFESGDNYHDHFNLSLPDQPGLYYPDGQIRDEVFVFASFELSRMGHAGVSCMDCHDPHTEELIQPVKNNMLCQRCHEHGVMDAPFIEPEEHSFHPKDSAGNRCVECHMPKTTYMQVDPRADHGFHSPDPLMTKEHGIPNACNNCHTKEDEEGVDWAVEWSEKWYGEALAESRQRKRVEAISAAYAGNAAAREKLLALLKDEEIPAWKATYAGLLGNYLPHTKTASALEKLTDADSPLVRNRAISALARLESSPDLLKDALTDGSRTVRIAAARGLSTRGLPIPLEEPKSEWETYLEYNADRPNSLFLLASAATRQDRPEKTRQYIELAIALDSKSPGIYHQAAILLSQAGFNDDARSKLYKGWELAPDNADFPYSLGLIEAEEGDLETAVNMLEEAVAMEPGFARAWYNLSLAYSKLDRPQDAARAMERARSAQSTQR
ncbi:MAG: ammonia-forming cytochrome c nitrite reductase subunit c552 [Opitutales bacterium]